MKADHTARLGRWLCLGAAGLAAIGLTGAPPPTALAIALLAMAVPLLDARPTARARPPEWLILAAALTAFMSLARSLEECRRTA